MLGMASAPFEIPFLFTGHLLIGASHLQTTPISLWESENPNDKRSLCVSVKVPVCGGLTLANSQTPTQLSSPRMGGKQKDGKKTCE